jgi:hypothetical protein
MKQLAKIFRRLLFAILLFALGYWVAEWLATPPRFDLSQIAFSHALREEKDMPVVEVFFVTNRAALPGGQEFSQESSEALAYGIAEVRIPENFRLADVQRPEICAKSSTPSTPASWQCTRCQQTYSIKLSTNASRQPTRPAPRFSFMASRTASTRPCVRRERWPSV